MRKKAAQDQGKIYAMKVFIIAAIMYLILSCTVRLLTQSGAEEKCNCCEGADRAHQIRARYSLRGASPIHSASSLRLPVRG